MLRKRDAQDGGEFVRLESLDLQKYAQRPAIAKALCDYMPLGIVFGPRWTAAAQVL